MPTEPLRISLPMSARSIRQPVKANRGKQMMATLHMRMTMESDGPVASDSERTNTGDTPHVRMAKVRASRAVVLEFISPIEAMEVIWSMVRKVDGSAALPEQMERGRSGKRLTCEESIWIRWRRNYND